MTDVRFSPVARASVLVSGILFGLGLAVSQMIDPAKVLAFLDVAGEWDPTLALVMIGALMVTVPAFPLVLRRASPLFAGAFALPAKKDFDSRLLGGAVTFGIGWGLAGLCPGPAVAALVTGRLSILVFVLGMVAGMVTYRRLDRSPAGRLGQRLHVARDRGEQCDGMDDAACLGLCAPDCNRPPACTSGELVTSKIVSTSTRFVYKAELLDAGSIYPNLDPRNAFAVVDFTLAIDGMCATDSR